jgi:hypothetical protein
MGRQEPAEPNDPNSSPVNPHVPKKLGVGKKEHFY